MAVIDYEGKLCWVIPKKVNLPETLTNHPPGFKFIIDHFYYILDYISSQIDYTDLRETEGYVNVNAERLKKYNYHYKKYLQYLVDKHILICDRQFIIGKKSRGYMFTADYLTTEMQTVIANRFTLVGRVKEDITNQQSRLKKYAYLTKWFNSYLEIDKRNALKLVEDVYPLPNYPAGIQGKKRGEPSPWVQRFKATRAIERLANKDFYCHIDENIERFHSNLTNLKREIRKIVTYNGQKLINVDISNSQPLLSALVLKKEFYEGELPISIKTFKSIKQLFNNKLQYSNTIKEIVDYITLVNSSKNGHGTAFNAFMESVESGNFYREAFPIMFPGSEFNKNLIKTAIFQTFFSANQFLGQAEAAPKKAFSLAYPEVYHVFELLKKKNRGGVVTYLTEN